MTLLNIRKITEELKPSWTFSQRRFSFLFDCWFCIMCKGRKLLQREYTTSTCSFYRLYAISLSL